MQCCPHYLFKMPTITIFLVGCKIGVSRKILIITSKHVKLSDVVACIFNISCKINHFFLCKQKPPYSMYMTVLIERDVFPYSFMYLFSSNNVLNPYMYQDLWILRISYCGSEHLKSTITTTTKAEFCSWIQIPREWKP